jgi:hypothetical protein
MFLAALMLLADGPISKWDSRTPDLSFVTLASLFDVERCLIDMPKQLAPVVYRQPDRPDEVTIIYPDQYGLSNGRVDLKKSNSGTQVTAWSMSNERVQFCAPR